MKTGKQQVPQIDLQVLLENSSYELQEKTIKNLAMKILEFMELSEYELSLLIVNDEKIKELNRDYRQKDKATDVLSFPQIEWNQPLLVAEKKSREAHQDSHKVLGDIVISLDHVAINAEKIGNTLAREFCFLLIHGILHLCGHDHMEKDEEILMFDQQKKILSLLSNINKADTKPIWFNCVYQNEKEN